MKKSLLFSMIACSFIASSSVAGELLEKYNCIKDNGEAMTIEVIDDGKQDRLSFVYDNRYGFLDLTDPNTTYDENQITEFYESKEGPYKNHWFGHLEFAEYKSRFVFDKNTLEGNYMSSQYIYAKSRALRLISKAKPYVVEHEFSCEKEK